MAIYLKIPGIDGNTSAKGFEKCITLSEFTFNVRRPVSMDTGNLANRAASTPNISHIAVSKSTDMSSPLLFKEAVGAADGKDVKIHFVRTKGDEVQEFLTYELSGCVVSGYGLNDTASDDPPTEEIELSFTKVIVTHTDYDQDDKIGSPVRAGYDIAGAAVV